jgi:signal recognition particle subunit SRP54
MFDFLAQKFSGIFSAVTGKGTLTEGTLQQSLEAVTNALLEADVPYGLVTEFVESVKQKVVGQKIIKSVKPGEQLIKVMYDTLVDFFGGQTATINFQIPSVIMVVGLQGSGKTTSIAKMAYFIQKEALKKNKKRRILLGSIDFYRPAAIDQLELLAQKADVSFYRATSTDPVKAAHEIYAYFKKEQFEYLFLDTAGRLHVDSAMLSELAQVDKALQPRYKLLVLDAMTGQESLNVATAFNDAIGFYGAILSKMDSDTRGGAAFAFRYALKKPILLVGTGEKLEDSALFHPERTASKVLGMGDLESLIERANECIKQSEQEAMERSLMSGRMTLDDFAKQIDMVNSLGSLSSLMKYMPGAATMGLSSNEIQRGQKEMGAFRAIMSSMTKKERFKPDILTESRKKRIALGAGVELSAVDILLQRFEQAQQYAKLFKRLGSNNKMFRMK